MPFDDRDFPSARGPRPDSADRSRRWVSAWLTVSAGMILVMVVLGGATRLTGSGLSIMEWAPLTGVLPPFTQHEWERLFALYKHIPQYQLLNASFTLDDFKRIFWLEWVHRLWGRLIGAAFVLPLAVFAARGMISRRLLVRLLVLFVLGALQGGVGWFMVASGFEPASTTVSPYRLVLHLLLAVALYAAVLWTALSSWPAPTRPAAPRRVRVLALATLGCVFMTIAAGGFVAGLHAGLDYNTFPLMGGRLVPAGYAALRPFARNLFENVAAAQFDHRLLATVTAGLTVATVIIGLRVPGVTSAAKAALTALAGSVLLQYALGVATLLNVVPVDLAVAHQATAMLALTAVLVVCHALRRRTPA